MRTSKNEPTFFTMRLCHIKKQRDKAQQFGFNLASRTTPLCHYIGRVDPNTPAYMSGLRSGDRIIEVNDKNVSSLTYEETLSLLKKGAYKKESNSYDANELNVLVIDKKADEYLRRVAEQKKSVEEELLGKERNVLRKRLKSAAKDLDEISSEFSIKFELENNSKKSPTSADIEMITYI